jgi:hypothetical protein
MIGLFTGAGVEPWRPRGIKVRGRAVIEDDSGRLRIRITPEVIWSWGLNADQEKRFASIGATQRRVTVATNDHPSWMTVAVGWIASLR